MIIILWNIFDVFTNLLEASIYLWFFKKISFVSKTKSKILIWGSYVILALVIGVCDHMKVLPIIKTILFMLTGSILIAAIYQIRINRIMVANLIWFITTIMSESIIYGILAWIYGYESKDIFMEENIIRFQAIFMSKIIFFIILLYTTKILNPIKWRFNAKGIVMLLIQAFPFVVIILITIENSLNMDKVFNIPTFYLSIIAMVSLITYFLSFWLTENYFTNIEKEKEYIKMNSYEEKQLQYHKMKKESHDNMQKIYHDLKYFINIINKMEEKIINEINDYVDDIKISIEQSEYYYNTGNTIVDMIFMEKKKQAEELNIIMDIEIESYCLEGYKTIYLCSIFSNTLDNAIETSKDLKALDKKITVKIFNDGSMINILIANFYEGKRKIRLGKFLTTKTNTENHGWGIANIIDSVEKCNGKIDIKLDNNKFSLFIILDNKNYNLTIEV